MNFLSSKILDEDEMNINDNTKDDKKSFNETTKSRVNYLCEKVTKAVN
jgi:hypothetical protein